jgi:hypothetical protein
MNAMNLIGWHILFGRGAENLLWEFVWPLYEMNAIDPIRMDQILRPL